MENKKKPQRIVIKNDTGLGKDTKITLEDGTPIKGCRSVEISGLDMNSLIMAKVEFVFPIVDVKSFETLTNLDANKLVLSVTQFGDEWNQYHKLPVTG